MKNKADILLKEYKSEPKRRATFADWLNPYVTGNKYASKIYDKFALIYPWWVRKLNKVQAKKTS